MNEHGEKDERERPGITGSKDEGAQAAEGPDTPKPVTASKVSVPEKAETMPDNSSMPAT